MDTSEFPRPLYPAKEEGETFFQIMAVSPTDEEQL